MRLVALVLLSCAIGCSGEPQVLIGWDFETEADLKAWQRNAHVADVKVASGALSARVVDWDPIFISPTFEVPARHSQWIETRIRATKSGQAEFFWTNTLKTPYGGFSPGKETPFELIGDGQWHVYRIRPFWEPEQKIIKLRLDLPGGSGQYEVDYVRVVEGASGDARKVTHWKFATDAEGWTLEPEGSAPTVADGSATFRVGSGRRRLASPLLVNSETRHWFFVTIRMSVSAGQTATLGFATSTSCGLHAHPFPIQADGQPHTYLIDLSGDSAWRGFVRVLTLEPTDAAEAAVVIDYVKTYPRPTGEAELAVRDFGLADGLPRAGQRLAISAALANTGCSVAKDVQAVLALPQGLASRAPLTQEVGDLWYGETRLLEWPVELSEPFRGKARLTVHAPRLAAATAEASLEVAPGLGLPKADYVPEPKPAKTVYQVGAYYFPGFPTWAKWRPIADFPERKPLLGWYDESQPEVADWQIKWAVEHGISFFAVDWYWCQGGRQLEHWLHDAYLKSRYRRYLRFCLLWANHNPPGTSSEPDLLAVTDFWLANYFKRPEYLTVEGKPVVIIFSPHQLTADLGSQALAAAFGTMRERCRAAGLPGLYLVACTGSGRGDLERLKAEGYDAGSGYNYPSLGSGGRRWFPYADNIEGYKQLWTAAADLRLLKEIPVLSGGWDSRPWHGRGALVLAGRTPALFERHCRDAKEFLDRRDAEMPPALRMCLVEAWNEWGEGSYIGPHREHGFGYLEAVRCVFAPDSPKPLPVTPRDIGLGPYDCPRPVTSSKAAWDFAQADDRAAWRAAAQIALDADAPFLKGTATGSDPILQGPVVRIPAQTSGDLWVEMRTTAPDTPQLFWSTTTGGVSENNSVRFDVPGDGRFHVHRIEIGRLTYWTGLVTGLRFDPVTRPEAGFEIRSIRFAAQGPKD